LLAIVVTYRERQGDANGLFEGTVDGPRSRQPVGTENVRFVMREVTTAG
jgi:hypothetical protein